MNSLPLISFIVNRKKYKEFIKYSISMQNQLYYTRFGTRKDKRTIDRTLSYTIEAADRRIPSSSRLFPASPDTFEENAGGNSA